MLAYNFVIACCTQISNSTATLRTIESHNNGLTFNIAANEKHLPIKKRKRKMLELDNILKKNMNCQHETNTLEYNNLNIFCNIYYEKLNLYAEKNNKNRNKFTKQITSTEFKTSSDSLFNQIRIWNSEDREIDIKHMKIISDNKKKEIKMLKKARNDINKLFRHFKENLDTCFTILKNGIKNSTIEETQKIMFSDQLLFFEYLIKYINQMVSVKFRYNSSSNILISKYSNIPNRLYILKDIFQVLEKYKVFKLSMQNTKIFCHNNSEKNALNEIGEKLKTLFLNLNSIAMNVFSIVSNLTILRL
ncbi:uncharacterized protein VNE69_04104 [Vairimorpha necatrix]|uniref:Uncharacterized protein n=1 Tax=Vairimorpha necatrix TaxID=6039 RepID=A0AAX4JBF0_9MICR